MQIRAPAILVAARQHGETAVIARLLTEGHGLIAGYVAGGRGRHLRPVVIPGNRVEMQLSARSETQLPFMKLELVASCGPWLGEPLQAAAIGWVAALTASVLPERQPYPHLYGALGGLLKAICAAQAARGWAGAMVGYEMLLMREMGYGGEGAGWATRPSGELAQVLEAMDALADPLDNYLLAERRADVMAARHRLRQMLGRIET